MGNGEAGNHAPDPDYDMERDGPFYTPDGSGVSFSYIDRCREAAGLAKGGSLLGWIRGKRPGAVGEKIPFKQVDELARTLYYHRDTNRGSHRLHRSFDDCGVACKAFYRRLARAVLERYVLVPERVRAAKEASRLAARDASRREE